jgi:hypothetical protein
MPQAYSRTLLWRFLPGRFGTYWLRSLQHCLLDRIDFSLDYFIELGLIVPWLAALLASRCLGVVWSPPTTAASTTPTPLSAASTRLAIVTITFTPFGAVPVLAFVFRCSFDALASSAPVVAAAAVIATIMPLVLFVTLPAAALLAPVAVMSLPPFLALAHGSFRMARFSGLWRQRFLRLNDSRRLRSLARGQSQFAGETVPIDRDLFRRRLERRARLRSGRFLGCSLSRTSGGVFPLARFRRYLDANLLHQRIPIGL